MGYKINEAESNILFAISHIFMEMAFTDYTLSFTIGSYYNLLRQKKFMYRQRIGYPATSNI